MAFGLSVVLLFLLIWLLGFVLRDIGSIEGPDYQAVYEEHVDETLRTRAEDLDEQIGDLQDQVARQTELQADLRRSMNNARETMQQMMDLHRLSLEQQANPTVEERNALATAQQRFLDAQEKFEEANRAIAASNETKFRLRQELGSVRDEMATQEEPAREDWVERGRRHQFKVASFKLAFIVPLFLAAAGVFFRYRHSAFRSILLAALAATFWKTGVVMFDHFPREFFKYIAIAAAIVIVLAFLVWLLRRAANPSRDLLLKRFREAYRGHTCPVCSYPIARGPLRYARWTRRGPALAPGAGEGGGPDAAAETPYVCPSCGSTLFEACTDCGKPRHSLLPFCEHCGGKGVGSL
jgi:hypothetical protein